MISCIIRNVKRTFSPFNISSKSLKVISCLFFILFFSCVNKFLIFLYRCMMGVIPVNEHHFILSLSLNNWWLKWKRNMKTSFRRIWFALFSPSFLKIIFLKCVLDAKKCFPWEKTQTICAIQKEKTIDLIVDILIYICIYQHMYSMEVQGRLPVINMANKIYEQIITKTACV